MGYKKPVMLAKSESKCTFVAGCPTAQHVGSGVYGPGTWNGKCDIVK